MHTNANTNSNTAPSTPEDSLKKLTLIGWTNILLKNGTIDLQKYGRMIERINKLS